TQTRRHPRLLAPAPQRERRGDDAGRRGVFAARRAHPCAQRRGAGACAQPRRQGWRSSAHRIARGYCGERAAAGARGFCPRAPRARARRDGRRRRCDAGRLPEGQARSRAVGLLIGGGEAPPRPPLSPALWPGAPSFDPSAREPLPLVLFRHPCEWRVRTVQALDRCGRRWRAAFESGSLIAIQAAVRAGVGIATLLPGNVEAGITVLDPRACRLPAPPRVELALYRRPALRNDPVADFLENLLWKAAGDPPPIAT